MVQMARQDISMQGKQIATPLLQAVLITATLLEPGPSNADSKADAKARFMEGIALFKAENYADALTAFEESYRLRKTPIVLFNIGMSQKALYRYTESIVTFRKLLEEKIGQLKPSIREESEEAIREMEALLGRLKLEGAPDGASLIIDGNVVGTTPLVDPIFVSPGRHTVEVIKEGYETLKTEINIPQGEVVTLSSVLSKLMAELRINCDESGEVVIDGDRVGRCPYMGKVAPGSHDVMVTGKGKKSVFNRIDTRPGRTEILDVKLEDDVPSISPVQQPADPVAPSERKTAAPEPDLRPFLVSGIVSNVLGIAGTGVGIAFTIRWDRHYDEVVNLVYKANQAQIDGNRALYDEFVEKYEAAKTELENNLHPADKAGIIAGYVTGGALTLTGAALLIVYGLRKRKSKPIVVAPSLGGLVVTF